MGNNVTLVLGAGASRAFGFPLGDKLRELILELALPHQHIFCKDAGLLVNDAHFYDFISAFDKSNVASIDSFLARRGEFSEIGRKCIAAILLRMEPAANRMYPEHRDPWPSYLFNIFLADTWLRVDFTVLKIVTFNYDRALEHFLFDSLKHSYGKSDEEVKEKLRELEIVHVYGSLGPTLPGEAGYLPYAGAVTSEAVSAAADALKVIPEGRHNDGSVQKARDILEKSNKIVFMGFSFDVMNMSRLNSGQGCARVRGTECGTVHREVLATCIGMTHAEAWYANSLFDGQNYQRVNYPPGFYNLKCLEFLRETLVLGHG